MPDDIPAEDGWYVIQTSSPFIWPKVACIWTDDSGERWIQTEDLGRKPAKHGMWQGWSWGRRVSVRQPTPVR